MWDAYSTYMKWRYTHFDWNYWIDVSQPRYVYNDNYYKNIITIYAIHLIRDWIKAQFETYTYSGVFPSTSCAWRSHPAFNSSFTIFTLPLTTEQTKYSYLLHDFHVILPYIVKVLCKTPLKAIWHGNKNQFAKLSFLP